MDKTFLKRDVIDLGILPVDQEKEFDRVCHSYLFEVMDYLGFGNVFMSCV